MIEQMKTQLIFINVEVNALNKLSEAHTSFSSCSAVLFIFESERNY